MGKKLEELYTNILSYASMKPDADGKVMIDYVFDDGEQNQVHIEGRGLVMPTDAQLRAYHPEKVVVFHPLQEFVNRGESEVVKALRHQVNVRLNYTVLVVAAALLKLVASPALHKTLTPEQRELLLEVKGGDVGLPSRFMEFATKRFAAATSRFFCNVYLKKAGMFKGEKHARVGVVQFPFYDIFEEEDIKLKKGDEEAFISVLQFIFPGSEDKETYNNFSDSRDAPWLDCMLRTSYNLAQRLNELLVLYKDHIDDAETFHFNDTWVDALDNIDAYRDEIRLIPTQKGNEGTIEVEGKEVSTVPKVPVPARAVPTATERVVPTELPLPAARPQPATYRPGIYAAPPDDGLVFDRYGRCLNAPPEPVPVYDTAPAEPGKVDFRALKAANPMVAAAAAVSTPMTEWQNQQQMRAMQPGAYYDPRLAGPAAYQPMVDAWGRPIAAPTMDPRFAAVDPRFMQPGYPPVDPRFAQQGYPMDPRFNRGIIPI